MASILFNCAAVISPRVRERRRAKVEREREYAANFATLQEENEKRVKRLSLLSAASQSLQEEHCPTGQRPPGYEEVVVVAAAHRKTGDDNDDDGEPDGDGDGRGRRPSFVAGEERVMEETGVVRDNNEQRARSLRVKRSTVDRRDWAAVRAATSTPPMGSTAGTPAASAVVA